LVLASPSNPTGTVLSADALADITAACRARGIAVIADEIYHGIVDGHPAAQVLDHHPEAFVVNSFSKYWSMTGWRVGWVVVPDSVVDTVERLQQNLYICAPHVSQVAALAALDATAELDGHVARYRENRSIVIDGLAAAGITDSPDRMIADQLAVAGHHDADDLTTLIAHQCAPFAAELAFHILVLGK
jgi:aspartate/methionine/tyrosine aminotransferase